MKNPAVSYLGTARHVLLLLVMGLSLLANTFVPAGGMIETDEDGKVHITICSGQGTQSAWLDVSTGQIDRQSPSRNDKDSPAPKTTQCPFAAHSNVAANLGDLATQSIVIIAEPYQVFAKPSLVFVGQTPLRSFARGPPISI